MDQYAKFSWSVSGENDDVASIHYLYLFSIMSFGMNANMRERLKLREKKEIDKIYPIRYWMMYANTMWCDVMWWKVWHISTSLPVHLLSAGKALSLRWTGHTLKWNTLHKGCELKLRIHLYPVFWGMYLCSWVKCIFIGFSTEFNCW